MATLIKTDGSKREVKPKHKTFSLAELYALIGCDMVEVVGLDDGRLMWLDEEGKYADPPKAVNAAATVLLHKAGGIPWDAVVGDVLVTRRDEAQ